jgi:hypothetical protein
VKESLIGNAGEYYVVAELLKRGVIAALAPRNAPAFDILATRETIEQSKFESKQSPTIMRIGSGWPRKTARFFGLSQTKKTSQSW